jgi:hypothetical protein
MIVEDDYGHQKNWNECQLVLFHEGSFTYVFFFSLSLPEEQIWPRECFWVQVDFGFLSYYLVYQGVLGVLSQKW